MYNLFSAQVKICSRFTVIFFQTKYIGYLYFLNTNVKNEKAAGDIYLLNLSLLLTGLKAHLFQSIYEKIIYKRSCFQICYMQFRKIKNLITKLDIHSKVFIISTNFQFWPKIILIITINEYTFNGSHSLLFEHNLPFQRKIMTKQQITINEYKFRIFYS